MRIQRIVTAISGLALAAFSFAHDEELEVTIKVVNGVRIITSNGLPDHSTGQFPSRGNPNSIRAQRYEFRMPVAPTANKALTVLERGLFGVALNGVVFDPGTAEYWNRDRNSGWRYEALTKGPTLGIDSSNAHVQPNGAYHYHGTPIGLLKNLDSTTNMKLIGYAADGFPIYSQYGYVDPNAKQSGVKELKSSYRIKSGTRTTGPGGKHDGTFTADWEFVEGSGDLDKCNGRTGVTPEYPDGTFYYVVTENFPHIPRFFRGTPDSSFMHRRPGSPPARGRRGGGGQP